MEQKAEILMRYFREGKSQRAIGRELKISRTTVQKYIKEYESKYEMIKGLDQNKDKDKIHLLIDEMSSAPKYDVSNRSKIKLTDEVTEEINKLVSENEKHRLSGRSKQQLKKIDIYEYLQGKGYDIGYTTVCNYIRNTFDKKEAFIRQEYNLGETLEFDWGDVKLIINGKPTTLNMGLFTTAKASYHYARLYQNQKMENFFIPFLQKHFI